MATYSILKMPHILQPKHSKLNEKEVEKILSELNISKAQIPKILSSDAAIEGNFQIGEVVKIERKEEDGSTNTYYRVVV